MQNFRKLDIWMEARRLVKEIYLLTKSFPMQGQFGITSQIRRAVVSIPSNIAKGSSKSSDKNFARFLEIPIYPSYELETQLTLCYNLEYINEEQFEKIILSLQSHQKKMYNFKKKLI